MKKSLLILTAAVGAVATTSCGGGSFSAKSVETQEDSVAYALGIDVANTLWSTIDSTLDFNVVCQGIMDYVNKNNEMTVEQNQEFLQTYFMVTLPAKQAVKNEKASNEMLAAAAKESGAKVSESGLVYIIEEAGQEPKVQTGDEVTAHYILSDANGNVLQSSKESGQPLTYVNTPGSMIEGFAEGVEMLGEGGKATLYLPYDIAYGEKGKAPMIGPKQALKFEVEVLSVKKAEAKK